MHLALDAEDVAVLARRTEGWIAGLQLAALSMRQHQDLPAFQAASLWRIANASSP